jgi:hypothetical protein
MQPGPGEPFFQIDRAWSVRLTRPQPREVALQAALAFAAPAFDVGAAFVAPSPLAFVALPEVDFTSHVSHLRSHVEGAGEDVRALE